MGAEIVQTGDFSQTCRLVKSIICQYLDLETKNDKIRTTLLSQTLKVQEDEVPLFFHFWPLSRDIDDLCFWPVNVYGTKS